MEGQTGVKYQLTIEVKTLDIPEAESIPEKLTVDFETPDNSMDKDEAVARTLIACGQGWVEMKKDVEKGNNNGKFLES